LVRNKKQQLIQQKNSWLEIKKTANPTKQWSSGAVPSAHSKIS